MTKPISSKTARRGLLAIIAAFIALALLYNWASPLFENSDEFFHFPLIKHLADSNGYLPVQSPDDLQDWRQQGNQPPLYHLMAALLIKPIDTSDYADVRRVNPHGNLGVVSESNSNAVIHPLDRSAEFRGGTAWALRLVRFFSTLLAAVVVACAYGMTVLTFPHLPRWVGLLAAALIAFNPMYLFVAASVNNDNLSNALISLVLLMLVWLYRREDLPPIRALLLIGFLLGLSLLSKLSTGPFMLLVGLFWLALARKHQALGYMVKWGVAALSLALLISGWWYIRNWQLYGDPSGLDRFLDIVGRRAIPLTADQLWSERGSFIQSFWGLFGGMTVPMAGWVYSLFNGLAALSLIGAIWFLWGRREAIRRLDLPTLVLIVWPIMAFISLIRWTALTWASQGRLWFIALTCLATLGAVGFYRLGLALKRPQAAWLPVGYTVAIALLAPFIWLRPAYDAPNLYPLDPDQSSLAHFYDPVQPEEMLLLTDFSFPDHIETGSAARAELSFCALTDLSRDWSVFVHLVNDFEIIVAQADFTPGYGALPTSELSAGQCWTEHHLIEVAAGVAADDSTLTALLGLYDARDNTRASIYIGNTTSPDTRLWVAETRLYVGDALQRFSLGRNVRLRDYALSPQTAAAGETINIRLDWEVLRSFEADYTVFVQIIDLPTANRVAASDQMPSLPTSAWDVGTIVEDLHHLQIAEDAPAGVYAVLVGFYVQPEAGVFARLRLIYDGVDTGFDALTLTQVRVE